MAQISAGNPIRLAQFSVGINTSMREPIDAFELPMSLTPFSMPKPSAADLTPVWPSPSLDAAHIEPTLGSRQHHVEQTEIMQQALRNLSDSTGVSLQEALDPLDVADDVKRCINALVGIGLDRSVAWAMLVRWLIEQVAYEVEVTLQAAVALESLVSRATEVQWRAAIQILEGVAIDGGSFGESDEIEDEISF